MPWVSKHPAFLRCLVARQTVAFEDRGLITVANPKGDDDDPPKNFTFDAVFAAEVTQRHIYDVCAAELIDACLDGYNGTIFA
jgi:kinesin family protein 3/17